jgi:hypothetical protein
MKYKKTIVILGVLIASTFIGITQFNTTQQTNVEFVDAIVLLQPGVEVDFPFLEFAHNYASLNGFAARMPMNFYHWLENAWFVSSIQIDQKVSIMEDTLDWGVDDIDAEEVWGGAENAKDVVSGNVAGQGVKVCIIDSGIDYTHPDLDDVYAGGYDYVDNDNDPLDGNGHGTHCAGIVAAEDNEEGVIGVAPYASIYSVRSLDDAGSGSLSDVVAGIDWAINNNMDVLSMSLGASSGDSALQDACDRAYNAGIVVVAASGNDGQSSISYPARYSSCIAVGAIDSNHNLASFSNYGSQQEVVAPGVNIYSTMPTYSVTLNQWWYGGLSQNYDQMSGTSMATPMVAGVAALVLSANSGLTASEVRTILQDTATDLGSSGWDQTFGYGNVDALAAVDAAGGGTPATPPSKVTGLTATAVSESQIDLSWDANPETDIDHYNVYRGGSKIAETSGTSYSDTGLNAGTTYTYEVSAVDTENEEGPKSDPASATTQGQTSNVMYVYSIEMWSEPVYWWIFLIGHDVYTKVTVYDQNNNPLEGVTVYLDLTLPSGSHSTGNAITGSDGTVTFIYERGASGTYTSTVTDLVKTNYVYDDTMNVETSETLSV